MATPADLVAALTRRGPLGARDLMAELRVSQPSLSRLSRTTPNVHRIGRARATTYALAREVRTFGSEWPVYQITENGRPRRLATLRATRPDGWWYESVEQSALLAKSGTPLGLFRHLPWFLEDLRPQGFLGRMFARAHAGELGLPEDPRHWTDDGVLVSLLSHGDDLPGDFVIGEANITRVQRSLIAESSGIARGARAARYSDLADAVLRGEVPASSAAGEQPKFTTRIAGPSGEIEHVLVKFSPPSNTVAGRRWADLLLAEHLAAEVLAEQGFASSRTEWIAGERRVFLEIARFDRVGAQGRRGIVSLLALDAELFGKLDTWPQAAARLLAGGWLVPKDAEELIERWWFGRLIDNSDLHFGNVSLKLTNSTPLELLPSYDMLPMAYQPSSTGEIVERDRPIELPPPETLPAWRRAAEVAVLFWNRVIADRRVSEGFRRQLRDKPSEIRRALDRLG